MTLDPRTGKPDANTKLFTKPISVTSMDQAVQDKRPWYSPFSHTERPLRWDEDLDDWWHAYLIGNHLSMYLRNHHNPNMLGLIEGTGWKGITLPSEYKLHRQDGIAKWGVMHMWQRKTSEPHVVCALADKEPLLDGYISVPEMRVILTLSGVRAMDEGHHHHSVIPVTVIFAAGKKVRVVVGIVDSKNKEIEVRTSRIIDVSKGERSNWKDWITILCWMVGQPTGTTT